MTLSRTTRGAGIGYTELALFLRGRLHEGLYCGYKGKGYATEVVIVTKRLSPNDIKDGLDDT